MSRPLVLILAVKNKIEPLWVHVRLRVDAELLRPHAHVQSEALFLVVNLPVGVRVATLLVLAGDGNS